MRAWAFPWWYPEPYCGSVTETRQFQASTGARYVLEVRGDPETGVVVVPSHFAVTDAALEWIRSGERYPAVENPKTGDSEHRVSVKEWDEQMGDGAPRSRSRIRPGAASFRP